MDRRLELQDILESLMAALHPGTLPDSGSANQYHVYFQPDQNVRLTYPAIVYQRDKVHNQLANNRSYFRAKGYQITIIDRNPDSKIPDAVAMLPYTRFVSHNKADGLNHDVYLTYI